MLNFPSVTLLYGGLVGLLIAALGINVTRVRIQLDANAEVTPLPPRLHRAARAHGNATEWAPILLFLLLVVELAGGGRMALHAAGGLIFLSRLAHAVFFLASSLAVRGAVVINWLLALWLPGWALWLHFAAGH